MIFSIYNYDHFRDILSIKELEEFLFVVIKDNNYFDKFYDIYSYKYIISNPLLTESDDFNKLIISERTKCVSRIDNNGKSIKTEELFSVFYQIFQS